MTKRLGFFKTTIIGGFVFLIPAVIVVVALGKVIGTLKLLANVLSSFFGIESLVGGFVLEFLAIIATVLLCFVAGLLGKRTSAKRLRERLDATLLNFFPGYTIVKGFAENLRQADQLAGSFVPVLVRFDDYVQIAFETHRDSAGKVAVYLPGAPNPWSGMVVYVSPERVELLAMTLTEALRNIRTLGVEVATKEQKGETAQCA